jgi:hypothetical protein
MDEIQTRPQEVAPLLLGTSIEPCIISSTAAQASTLTLIDHRHERTTCNDIC